jgi:hypothetical protein
MLIDIYMIQSKYKSSDIDWANWTFLKALAFALGPPPPFPPIEGLRSFAGVGNRTRDLLVIGYLRGSYRLQHSSLQVYRLDGI